MPIKPACFFVSVACTTQPCTPPYFLCLTEHVASSYLMLLVLVAISSTKNSAGDPPQAQPVRPHTKQPPIWCDTTPC